MLRHSVSQIFHSTTPHDQDKLVGAGTMISSLQPSRPRIQPQILQTSPMNQQPHLPISSLPPRSQIEALPPSSTLPLTSSLPQNPILAAQQFHQFQIAQRQQQTLSFDPSIRHPVFFTDRLKKAPNGVSSGNEGEVWGSPVMRGYVFEDRVKTGKGEGVVKL